MISKKVQFVLYNMKYSPNCFGSIIKDDIKYNIHISYYRKSENTQNIEYYLYFDKYSEGEFVGNLKLEITEAEYYLVMDKQKDLQKEAEKQLSSELFGE